MTLIKRDLIVIASLLLTSLFGVAAKENVPVPTSSKITPNDVKVEGLSKEQFDKLFAEAKARKSRDVASSNIDFESLMSKDYKAIRTEIFNLKSVDQIDPLITTLKNNYANYAPDAQLIALHIMSIQNFKGMLARLYPLAQKTNVTTSVYMSSIYGLGGLQSIYWPNAQSKLLLAYISEPYEGINVFEEADELQAWMSDVVYPYVVDMNKKISDIPVSVDKPIVWDNKLVLNQMMNEKMDSQDRYFLIGPAEKHALLAREQVILQNICEFRTYSVKGLMKLTKDLGKLTGFDGWLGEVDGVTPLARARVLNSHSATFVKFSDGNQWSARAFFHFGEAVKYSRIAWSELENKPTNQNFVLNPGFFNANDRAIVMSLPVLGDLSAGKTKIKSNLTGETINVNLRDFYMSPPTNLKNLLPKVPDDFDSSPSKITKNIKGTSVTYVNPFHGKVKSFSNLQEFKTLFPDAKNSEDLIRHIRILSQSWGGSILSLPLDIVVR